MSVFTGICKSSGIFLDFEVIQQYSISEFSSSITVLQSDIFSSQYGVFNSFVLPKVSCVTLGNSILAENKDWVWVCFFFFLSLFFLALFGDFVDRFFILQV